MSEQITLIDAGTGNLRSVHKAFERVGADVTICADPDKIASARRLVLPGVGAFGDFMRGLRERNMEEAIISYVRSGSPLLGICVGMQALFEVGEEYGRFRGLGLLPGKVIHFPPSDELKIPHTGWNQIHKIKDSSLLKMINEGEYAYFNHAFFCDSDDSSAIIAETEYGITFTCATQKENLFGVQFHPEKSQRVGLQILENFTQL
jgi:glutamine amidotransferase